MNQDWAGVPKHLLDMILKKVGAIDYVQFGVVCDWWNSATKENSVQTESAPMLLVPDRDEPAALGVYSIRSNKFLSSKLWVPFTKRFAGSSRGWLVAVHEDWTISLYKPFSDHHNNINIDIKLPCLFPPEPAPDGYDPEIDDGTDLWTVKDYHIKKVVITSDPLLNPDECTIIAYFGEDGELAFLRLHKDPTWTIIKIENGESICIHDLVQCGNKLYTVATCGLLHSFNLEDPHRSILRLVTPCVDEINLASVMRYVVESCHGKFYQVIRYTESDEDHCNRYTTKFEVQSLDFEKAVWTEVTSLDDEALFVGDNSSISIQASKSVGCQQNCIYFSHDYDSIYAWAAPVFCDAGIYNLQTKEITMYFTTDSTFLSRPPIWVVPTVNV